MNIEEARKVLWLKTITAHIKKERASVEGNRELIRIYEEKIRKVIEKVWEG